IPCAALQQRRTRLMAIWVDQLRQWVEDVIVSTGYPGLLLMMVLEGLFPPIPSEVIMPLAGSLAAQNRLNYWAVVAVGTAGSMLVAVLLYALGRRAGQARLVGSFLARYGRYLFISEDDWDRALAAFERNGAVIVLAGRLIPGLRSLVSIPAGLHAMPLRAFL